MLNPINFITPPLLFLYVFKFCLEERLARPPAVLENFLSLLIFPAPYGATDTSPAGCSRPRGSQQTSSGSGCHLHRPVHLSEQNRTQQNRDSSSLHLTAWVRHHPPDKNQMLFLKYSEIQRRWQVKTKLLSRKKAHVLPTSLEKSSWKIASEIMPNVFVCMCVCVSCQSVFERVHACVHRSVCVCVFRGLEVCLWQSHGREGFILACHWLEKGL